jgi:hypothetical protein
MTAEMTVPGELIRADISNTDAIKGFGTPRYLHLLHTRACRSDWEWPGSVAHTPVIPDTQELEMGRIESQG